MGRWDEKEFRGPFISLSGTSWWIVPLGILLTILIGAILLGIAAFILALCWNYVMPHVAGLPVIDIWHAVSLIVIAAMAGAVFNYKSKGREE